MRELELDEPAGLDLLPVPLAAATCRPGPTAGASSSASRVAPAGRPLRLELFVFDPQIAARERRRVAGAERRPRTASTTRRHDNRLDITLESGDAISLWWLNRSEWDGLIEVAGFEVEALYGGFDRRAVRRERERVRLGCPQARSPTTRSPGSTTRGARASPRTWSSTSRRRARPAAPSSSSACGTGRISVPIAKAGVPRDRRRRVGAGCSRSRRGYAAAEGVGDLLDLRLGDLRDPPVPSACRSS